MGVVRVVRGSVTHRMLTGCSAWNVQFPQAIRVEGAKYVVEQIVESKQGNFYRALGDIKQLGK